MPRKSLGQHFLSDPRILGRIADLVPGNPGDLVLEIGPGKGALTRALLAKGFRITAIERDRELVPRLRSEFPAVTFLEGDALAIDWVAALGATDRWFAVGNIPYNITTPLIDRALDARPLPTAIVFLVQKEVALRLTAAAGTREYGALTVGAQTAAVVERLMTVVAGAFWPPPRVDSAVVRLTPRPPSERPADPARFRRLVVGLFTARRKQLIRALRTAFGFEPGAAAAVVARAGLDPSGRAESLGIADFRRLEDAIVDEGMADQLAL